MLAPVLMDAVKVLLWLLLQQVYVMKGLEGWGLGGVGVGGRGVRVLCAIMHYAE